MAVPFINILAPSMGGIGPVEMKDIPKLGRLSQANGVPFYIGRFYPKNSSAFWNGLIIGFFSQTPPWVAWEEISSTQVWAVPTLPDQGGVAETIIGIDLQITNVDVWPRDEDEGLQEWENTLYDDYMQAKGWGSYLDNYGAGYTIDPGVDINHISVIGFVSGHFTEYAFYDQELQFINGAEFNQPQYQGLARTYAGERGMEDGDLNYSNYKEVWRIRGDGVWVMENANVPAVGAFDLPDTEGGYPENDYENKQIWKRRTPSTSTHVYDDWVITHDLDAAVFGNEKWDQYTKYITDGNDSVPQVGNYLQIKSSELDTVVYTIRMAAVTNFSGNTPLNWYFYLPVRYNANKAKTRIPFLLNRAGTKRNDDPTYTAP